MSKIGRKPIILSSAQVDIRGNIVLLKGPKGSLEYKIPSALKVVSDAKSIKVQLNGEATRKNKMLWGLHRALLANSIIGLEKGFQSNVKIVGLGFKAQISGKKMIFTLGYSHKIDYTIPDGITVVVDKTGQLLTVSGNDKALVGHTCDEIRALRPPEPYKGTGIMKEDEVILRKAGKTKSA